MPAPLLLELIGAPAALWSADRTNCLFNRAAAELFGYDHDGPAAAAWWRARVEGADRARFMDFCNSLASGQRSTCRYRFTPAAGGAIDLHETAERVDPGGSGPVIVSRYAILGESRRMAHQLGNHLQAVRGELDLLRLSGALPEQAAASVLQPLNAVHELLQKIGKFTP